MDEGRWREARHGQPITAYYLRDNLGDMLPANAEEIAPRRWREGSGNPQFGYDVLHLKDAFQRYLAKGLPGQVVGETQELGRGAEPKSDQESEKASPEQNSAQKEQKTSDTSDHPAHGRESEDTSDTYSRSDTGRMLAPEQANTARNRSLAERRRRAAAQKRAALCGSGAKPIQHRHPTGRPTRKNMSKMRRLRKSVSDGWMCRIL